MCIRYILYWHHTELLTCINITLRVAPLLTWHCELHLYWNHTVSYTCTEITLSVTPILKSHCKLHLYWNHTVSYTYTENTLSVTPVVSYTCTEIIPAHSDCERRYDKHALPPSQQLLSTLPNTTTHNSNVHNILHMLHVDIQQTNTTYCTRCMLKYNRQTQHTAHAACWNTTDIQQTNTFTVTMLTLST